MLVLSFPSESKDPEMKTSFLQIGPEHKWKVGYGGATESLNSRYRGVGEDLFEPNILVAV